MCLRPPSEADSQADLAFTSRQNLHNHAKIGRRAGQTLHGCWIRVVEEVEHLKVSVQLPTLPECETPGHANIHVDKPWSPEGVAHVIDVHAVVIPIAIHIDRVGSG